MRADVALAHDDYRNAVTALAEDRVDVSMAVRAFESTVATAMDAILDPQTTTGARDSAVDALTAIAARSWAMTQVEAHRTAALENVLGEASRVDFDPFHPSVLDFSEIEAAAAQATQEARTLDSGHDTSQDPRTWSNQPGNRPRARPQRISPQQPGRSSRRQRLRWRARGRAHVPA